jgi:KaiC/GvpD/RAD55 family RecA-like ATPase
LKTKASIVVCIALSILVATLATDKALGASSYAVSAVPSTINKSQNATITVSWNGGAAVTPYTFKITVTKPSGQGSAWTSLSTLSNSTGGGAVALTYPQPTSSWTVVSGTVNTDIEGTYLVSVDKTSPNPTQTGVATTSFTVTHLISITITSPGGGSNLYRGSGATITALLADARGLPVASGSATATTPKGTLPLSQGSQLGTYSGQYLIQLGDPIGPWNITVTGTLSGGNYGSSFIIVTISSAQLIVLGLATTNAYQAPTADFNPGDSLYATFRIAYSSSGFLGQGTFNVQVRNPSGAFVANLTSIYDSNRGLYYTPSGFQITSSDPAGAWDLVFPTNSLSDSYGNSGPSVTVTYRFQVHQPVSPVLTISPFYYGIIALAVGGGLGTTVFLKRFNKTTTPFDELFKLTGGELQPPMSLMLTGNAGAGTSTLGLQLLYRDLKAGKWCGLLSYDAFPSEVQRRMSGMGWDVTPYLEKGQLRVLDIYSALAGVESATIRDATDFTEISIQVTNMLDKAKGPATILLDSVTPIFNAAQAKDCVNFLQVIAAKVKNSGGKFIFTSTKGSMPEDARLAIESLVDGVIDLSLVKKGNSLTRFLQVRKLSGREISSAETEFEMVPGKGILFLKQRIALGFATKK